MPVSDYGAQTWAGIAFGIGTPPANFYVALCTAEPSTGWDGSVLASIEPQGSTSYVRQALAVPTNWTLSDANYVINAAALTFPVPDIDWGQITNFALTDAATAGNLWAWGQLLTPSYVAAGYAPTIPVGTITVGISDQLAVIAE